jgi:hypothetical protein
MPQFTNWEWQGEGDYYKLVGIDPMGEGLNQYSVLAEIKWDVHNELYRVICYFPEWTLYVSSENMSSILIEIVERYLKDKGVIE